MNNKYILIAIAIMSIVTIVLRFLPFIFLDDDKEYKLLNYLSKVMPCAVMGMLVAYCLIDTASSNDLGFLPVMIASGITILVHLWKRKTLFSILSGTIVYMLLVQYIFL